MKSLFSKLLPLVFIAMLGFAPMKAEAAGPIPTGPREGMFDCLGTLDWGCRVISFLFQQTDNTLIYVKDGNQVTETQTPAAKAFRAMMEFFSNALLIIASIKLLFELIQMTAESAKTGQVGGKDTNQLWAPIRLVVAIGLLVPIANEGGLNSAQLIVMQIAKWGSGMASQAWKLYTQNFIEDTRLTTPTPPRVAGISYTVAKSYACQGFVNYFADSISRHAGRTGTGDDHVDEQTMENGRRIVFKNKLYNDVCGSIRFKTPQANSASEQDDAISRQLAQANENDFNRARSYIKARVDSMIQRFLPEGRELPQVDTEELDDAINEFQTSVTQRVNSNTDQARTALQSITDRIQNTANDRGWTSAGSLFLDITRAQGALMNGAMTLPETTGPNMETLRNYESAFQAYQQFVNFLENGNNPIAPARPTAESNANISAAAETQDFNEFLWSVVRHPRSHNLADVFFRFLDNAATWVQLWDGDPRKAFGDLGSTTNPFGEIAALGHKKIRLALNYISYAFAAMGAGLVAGFLSSSIGAFVSGIAPILMLIASLFLLAGVLLAYIVPIMPFTRFFFSILTWIGSLIEAMVLVPFMALAFLTPKGEGFTGPNARNAIFLIFQLFLRPILCLFGLIGAMLLFYVAAKFLNAAFYEATGSIYQNEGSAMRFMQKLVYSFIYVTLIYSAANISFKMIEHFPRHALKWMGSSVNEESYDDHNSFMGIATAVGGQQLLSNLQNLPQNMMNPISKAVEARKADKSAAANKKSAAASNNMQMLAAGGVRNNGSNGSPMPLDQQGAVSMPLGSQQQISAATEHRDQVQSELRANEQRAQTLESEIAIDSAQYESSVTSGTPDVGLYAGIQAKIGQLNQLGRSAPAIALALAPPTGRAPITDSPNAAGTIPTLRNDLAAANADLARLRAPA